MESSTEPSVAAVREALDDIVDPCSAARGTDISIVEMGLVEAVDVTDGTVHVDMRVTSPGCMMVPFFHREIDERVGRLPGVSEVELTTDAGFEWRPSMMTDEARDRRAERRAELRAEYGDEIPGIETGTTELESDNYA
jgi:metal-sulfur cluster biosynthetic enzyme